MTEEREREPDVPDGAAGEGEGRPVDPIAARLYDQLRKLASRVLAREGQGAPVDATELVHECYLRLARLAEFKMLGRDQFMALAASLLRSILVDLARRRAALKRGGGWERTTLTKVSDEVLGEEQGEIDLLELDRALRGLEVVDPRQHRIVELKFFAGLSGDEISRQLGISRRTVTKEWTVARAWLRRELRA